MPKNRVVIFLHIPKTAGRTLYDILNRAYGRSQCYTFERGRHWLEQSIVQFENLPQQEKIKYTLLRGHTPFGIHHVLDKRPYTYFTLIREPVGRVISHYAYVKRTPHHALHQQVCQMSLYEYAASDLTTEICNGQTRLLAGDDTLPCDAQEHTLLHQALENINSQFSFVGITEEFDVSILLLYKILGWRKLPTYTAQNVTKNQRYDNVDEQTLSLIAERNLLDLELYKQIKTRFFELKDSYIDAEQIEQFNEAQKRYYWFGRSYDTARDFVRHIRHQVR